MAERTRIAVFFGSNRVNRLCDTVVKWALVRVASHGGVDVDLIDPLVVDLQPRLGSAPDNALRDFRRRISAADGYLIVTPEYNHGYPAILKQMIDSALEEWRRKPAAFVSYGGQSGGLRAVEQLRLVFAELHVVTMRDSVSFVNAWERFDASGTLGEPEAAEAAMDGMLAHLRWWARVLREARASARDWEMAPA